MDKNAFFVGMDFGTFKTSITASNGKRETLHTAVGYPVDHVARAMLGRDMVFGDEIMEQRLALDVVRPFAKGALKYLDADASGVDNEGASRHRKAAKELVKHAVTAMDPPQGAAIYGVIGAPSRASITSKRFLIDVVKDAFDAVIIVAEPFSIAYGMGRLSDTLVVDIGAGTIDICPMCGKYPAAEDQLTLAMGGDAVDEEFYNRLRAMYPDAQLSLNMAREIKEKHGFVHDVNEAATVTLPVNGIPTQFDVVEPLKQACQTIVEPIVESLREVIAKFDPEFQRPMLQNILLAGGGSRLKGLDRMIEESLQAYGGGNVTKVHDSVYAGAAGALKLAMSTPPEHWQKLHRAEPRHQEVETQKVAA